MWDPTSEGSRSQALNRHWFKSLQVLLLAEVLQKAREVGIILGPILQTGRLGPGRVSNMPELTQVHMLAENFGNRARPHAHVLAPSSAKESRHPNKGHFKNRKEEQRESYSCQFVVGKPAPS